MTHVEAIELARRLMDEAGVQYTERLNEDSIQALYAIDGNRFTSIRISPNGDPAAVAVISGRPTEIYSWWIRTPDEMAAAVARIRAFMESET